MRSPATSLLHGLSRRQAPAAGAAPRRRRIFRFDASDAMPEEMSRAFWQAVLEFTADQSRLDGHPGRTRGGAGHGPTDGLMYPCAASSGRHDTLLRSCGRASPGCHRRRRRGVAWLLGHAGLPATAGQLGAGAVGISAIALVGARLRHRRSGLVDRSPRNLIGWVFLAISVAMASSSPSTSRSRASSTRAARVPQPMLLAGLGRSVPCCCPGAVVVGRPRAPALSRRVDPKYRHWRLAMLTLALSASCC